MPRMVWRDSGGKGVLRVRVFTLSLVLFLVGFWPQIAWGFLRAARVPPPPPEPKFFWEGRLACSPKPDCRPEENWEGNYLILAAVKGPADFPATDNKVALLVGNE